MLKLSICAAVLVVPGALCAQVNAPPSTTAVGARAQPNVVVPPVKHTGQVTAIDAKGNPASVMDKDIGGGGDNDNSGHKTGGPINPNGPTTVMDKDIGGGGDNDNSGHKTGGPINPNGPTGNLSAKTQVVTPGVNVAQPNAAAKQQAVKSTPQ